MSARSVCNGNRPCKYHSERAISFPFNRPLTRTLIPLQPKRSAESTDLRIARRKPTRFSSCSAIDSETSWARSEEHTSELQSRLHLVCRLLLEKKKTRCQPQLTHSQGTSAHR